MKKILASLLILTVFLSGCVTGSNPTNDDDQSRRDRHTFWKQEEAKKKAQDQIWWDNHTGHKHWE